MRLPASCVFALPFAVLLLPACAPENAPPSQPPPPQASDTCPATWLSQPTLASFLVPPDGGLRVVARFAAKGTQNYRCAASTADAGAAFEWTFLGPEATLADCRGADGGRHLASEAGASAPKWEALDGSFVVAKKLAAEPSKEPGAVPWLLLQVTSGGRGGTFGGAGYVQRTATAGGAMPSTGCDAAHAGSDVKVPYTADYWFLGR